MNYTLIIAVAGFIGLVATGITFWATYKQGVESSIQTDRIEEKIDRGNKKGKDNYEKLSQPLPTELKLMRLTVKIDKETFSNYLPELRKLVKKRFVRNLGDNHSAVISINDMNPEMVNMFNEKELLIRINVVNEIDLTNTMKNNIFSCALIHRISFENGDRILFHGNYSENKEYLTIEIESTKPITSTDIYLKNGISSVTEIANKDLWFDIYFKEDDNLQPPLVSVYEPPLFLRDNLNRSYNIDIRDLKHTQASYVLNNGEKVSRKEIMWQGKLKCLSLE